MQRLHQAANFLLIWQFHTFPKIVFFLSSQSQRSRVIKNWLLFVFAVPALAQATRPLWLKRSRECTSSTNGPPYMVSPPAPHIWTHTSCSSSHQRTTSQQIFDCSFCHNEQQHNVTDYSLPPQINLTLPVPVPVGSPPCTMNVLMMRWKIVLS